MTHTETKACAARAVYMKARYAARRAAGMCYACRHPATEGGKGLCPACYAKRRARERAEAVREHDRDTRRRMWQAVDWSRPTAEIAKAMDVTESAVRKRRAEAGVRLRKERLACGGRGRPKKSVDAFASSA